MSKLLREFKTPFKNLDLGNYLGIAMEIKSQSPELFKKLINATKNTRLSISSAEALIAAIKSSLIAQGEMKDSQIEKWLIDQFCLTTFLTMVLSIKDEKPEKQKV